MGRWIAEWTLKQAENITSEKITWSKGKSENEIKYYVYKRRNLKRGFTISPCIFVEGLEIANNSSGHCGLQILGSVVAEKYFEHLPKGGRRSQIVGFKYCTKF